MKWLMMFGLQKDLDKANKTEEDPIPEPRHAAQLTVAVEPAHQPELLPVELNEGIAFDRQMKIRREKISGEQSVGDVTGQPELIEVLLPPDPLQHQPHGHLPGLRPP